MTNEEFIKKVFFGTKSRLFLKECDFAVVFAKNDLKSCMLKFIGLSPKTYSYSSCRRVQCYSGRSRSISDLYRVMMLRFAVNKEDFLDAVVDLIANKRVGVYYCPGVKKIVFTPGIMGVRNLYGNPDILQHLRALVDEKSKNPISD